MTQNIPPLQIDWKPLQLFNLYRLLSSAIFIVLFISDTLPSVMGKYFPGLFSIISFGYFTAALLSIFTIYYQRPNFYLQVFGQAIVDIVAISLLMHASGGVSSGLGALLVVAVAGCSILTEGKIAFLSAAVATETSAEHTATDAANLGSIFFMHSPCEVFIQKSRCFFEKRLIWVRLHNTVRTTLRPLLFFAHPCLESWL